MRLLEMIDLADMPGGMGKFKGDARAMPASRKVTTALDDGDLMRHVRVHGIVGDSIDAGSRHDLARLVLPVLWLSSVANLSTICETECNQTAFRLRLSAERSGRRRRAWLGTRTPTAV